jgi:ADP-ribosylglycohydrolase
LGQADLLPDVYNRLAGTLMGTAIGDALGLPAEGMSAARIARRFGAMERCLFPVVLAHSFRRLLP